MHQLCIQHLKEWAEKRDRGTDLTCPICRERISLTNGNLFGTVGDGRLIRLTDVFVTSIASYPVDEANALSWEVLAGLKESVDIPIYVTMDSDEAANTQASTNDEDSDEDSVSLNRPVDDEEVTHIISGSHSVTVSINTQTVTHSNPTRHFNVPRARRILAQQENAFRATTYVPSTDPRQSLTVFVNRVGIILNGPFNPLHEVVARFVLSGEEWPPQLFFNTLYHLVQRAPSNPF
jgi:hypothetical protein